MIKSWAINYPDFNITAQKMYVIFNKENDSNKYEEKCRVKAIEEFKKYTNAKIIGRKFIPPTYSLLVYSSQMYSNIFLNLTFILVYLFNFINVTYIYISFINIQTT